jgi:hypothetical protein
VQSRPASRPRTGSRSTHRPGAVTTPATQAPSSRRRSNRRVALRPATYPDVCGVSARAGLPLGGRRLSKRAARARCGRPQSAATSTRQTPAIADESERHSVCGRAPRRRPLRSPERGHRDARNGGESACGASGRLAVTGAAQLHRRTRKLLAERLRHRVSSSRCAPKRHAQRPSGAPGRCSAHPASAHKLAEGRPNQPKGTGRRDRIVQHRGLARAPLAAEQECDVHPLRSASSIALSAPPLTVAWVAIDQTRTLGPGPWPALRLAPRLASWPMRTLPGRGILGAGQTERRRSLGRPHDVHVNVVSAEELALH